MRGKRFLISSIGSLMTYFVPKKRGFWVFLPLRESSSFNGNLKHFYLFLNDFSEIETLWLTKKEGNLPNLANEYRSKSYQRIPIWPLVRAEYIFTDNLLTMFRFGRFNYIQLWHGTGFKNILALNPDHESYMKVIKTTEKFHRLILANSVSDRERKRKAFLSEKVVITGSPRNDILVRDDGLTARLRRIFGVECFDRVILYAPTFRKHKAVSPFSPHDWRRLNEWAMKKNQIFLIKKHSNDTNLVVPKNLSNVRDVTDDVSDVQELLVITDLLISDYSSISTDYSLTRKPIIFFTYDFEDFVKLSRTLYYDFFNVVPGPFANDFEELFSLMDDMGWPENEEYKAKYNDFVRLFHEFNDDGSSRRLYEYIKGGFNE